MGKVSRRILLGLISVAGAGIGAYYANKSKNNESQENIDEETTETLKENVVDYIEVESVEVSQKDKDDAKEKLDSLLKAFEPSESVEIKEEVILENNNEELEQESNNETIKEVVTTEEYKFEDTIILNLKDVELALANQQEESVEDDTKNSLDSIVEMFSNKK